MSSILFIKCLVLFLINIYFVKGLDWQYKNEENWGRDFNFCSGKYQSPIEINYNDTIENINSGAQIMDNLVFGNYDKMLAPFSLVNDGHTITSKELKTTQGFTPYITGGSLSKNIFAAVNFQFHWGSPISKGSEHMIHGKKFDAELHIVHKIQTYKTVETAGYRAGTIAIIAIMLQAGLEQGKSVFPAFNTIFETIPLLKSYESDVVIQNTFKLSDLLGNVHKNQFYTYYGSLTSPPCSESVIWHIYPQPLTIPYNQLQNFFSLKDDFSKPLINNFRPLKPRNGRKIFFKPAFI